MQTNRFETFMDAVLAIIITVLVLKLAQPDVATWSALWERNIGYLSYFICFVVIFNTWYNDHNLFQMVDEIDNGIVFVYGMLLFVISLLPYFSTWVSLYPDSIPAQTMFGIEFLSTNVLYTVSTYLIKRANPYNKKIQAIDMKSIKRYVPVIMILIGFALTYTVYVYGIYVMCILATVYWFLIAVFSKVEIESSERFEALFDAIVAIILTVIVLEIAMAANGTWDALFELKLEFIAYAISFVVCFNYWNFNNNLFSIVHKIDGYVIWLLGLSMFVLSLIPYLSTFVALNFYSFVPQVLYGLDFIVVSILFIITTWALKRTNPGNVALLMTLNNKHYIFTIAVVVIGIIIGYLYYPPAVIISCLFSIVVLWLTPLFKRLRD